MNSLLPLLVILGPTASGKSRLGLEVAKALDGEIISADAFAVYRGMDIGTDKPGLQARRQVPHHLIDILRPDQHYSAGDFAGRSSKLIEEIRQRGRTPIIVGGTHFYIQALVGGLFPSPPRDVALRQQLERAWEEKPAELFRRLEEVDPLSAARIGPGDRQRILRALEVFSISGKALSDHWKAEQKNTRYRPLYTAPLREREELYARIEERVDAMFSSGFLQEVEGLLESGIDPQSHAFKAIGYREIVEMIMGKGKLPEVISVVKRSSRRFAKRQLTWLRRHQGGALQWVAPRERGGLEEILQLWKTHANLDSF